MAFHQPATNELRGDQLGRAGEEGLGEGWEIVGNRLVDYRRGLATELGSYGKVSLAMKPPYLKSLAAKNLAITRIIGTLLTLFASQVNAYAQLKPQGENGFNAYITKASVTLSTPSGNGSGTVVGTYDGRLIIVTAKHVIEGVSQGEEVEVYDKEGRLVGSAKGLHFSKSPNADVAIMYATRVGKSCIIPATLGEHSLNALSKLNNGSNITVAGYASTDKTLTRKPSFRISNGTVTSILSEQEAINGYQFSYNASTARGMSGGGVFVNGSVLIGTHGSGERDELRSFAKTGFNYAVPSDKAYELLRSTLGKNFSKAKLADITISIDSNVSKTLSAVCTDPFGKWYCTVVGNNQTGANDQVCFLGKGEIKQRKRIIVDEGRCGFNSHILCGLVPGYQ